jgi:hypothetical protein
MSVKKVVIEKKDLPPLTPDGEYLIRYRIISEDKNRTSHWSPIYTLDTTKVWNEETEEFESLIKNVSSSLLVTPTTITLSWGAQNNAALYDIFVKFKIGGSWQTNFKYKDSSSSHAYSFLIPSDPEENGYGATDIEASIQIAGIEKTKEPKLTISTVQGPLRAVIGGGGAAG